MRELLPILRRTGLWARPQGDLFDRFFEDFRLPSLLHEEREWVPAFDVSETEKEVIVKAEVPGMNKKDIDNLTKKYTDQIDAIVKTKSEEIMSD